MIKVGVLGAQGRMGATVCDAVETDPGLVLVARVDENDPLEGLVEAGAEVAVDFTVPSAVKDNVIFCLDNGIHAVVGTTGLSSDDIVEIEKHTGLANAFIAPNFAVGAVLMMHFSAMAADHYDNVEIIERHHEGKVDAPSGTALRTADLIAGARAEPVEPAVPTDDESRGLASGGAVIHSVRLPGSVAHQEVIFGAPGETLTIRHDSIDRVSFMPGVILAVKKVASLSGVTVGLEHLLDLS